VIANAVTVMRIATGEIEDTAGLTDDGKNKAAVEFQESEALAPAAQAD
jgi:hypothetical protein